MDTIKVTCALIHKDDKILIVQRGREMKFPFKWEFPGGKIEQNETAEDCILREIFEELNINIRIKKKLDSNIHNYPNFSIELIPFVADYIDGTINLSEHSKYLFIDKSDLPNFDWTEADIPIVKNYLAL